MGIEEIPYAVNQPKQRSLAVGEVHIRHHAVHPRLAAGVEDCAVTAVEHVVEIRVGRKEKQQEYRIEKETNELVSIQ